MNTTKTFINEFNFRDPDWATLPLNFPKLSKKGLSKVEEHLLDGIKLAWMVSVGRKVFAKSVAKRVMIGFSILVISVLLGETLLSGTQNLFTQSVSAKTVSESVTEMVQATMSAVFRNNYEN